MVRSVIRFYTTSTYFTCLRLFASRYLEQGHLKSLKIPCYVSKHKVFETLSFLEIIFTEMLTQNKQQM